MAPMVIHVPTVHNYPLGQQRRDPRMPEMGHFHPFPPPRLNGRYPFS